MPTGYTAGILDGSIKSFKQFATTCVRAFGAAIHMRDESISKKYEPRVPDDYYMERLEEAREELQKVKDLSDAQIIKNHKKELLDEEKRYKKRIDETLEAKKKLDTILSDVHKWTPPTEEHQEFKNFMKQQLDDTIRQDGDTSYYDDELRHVQDKLRSLEDEKKFEQIATELRIRLIESAEESIESYTKRYDEEVKRCDDANKWVADLMNSIEKI